ncbi:phosphotransferase [Paenibacillus anaericanus]|nr:phosphotransferase [Paenibacillus anaericanus]
MDNSGQYVLPDGTLDDRNIWRRETLNQGMNGKLVERFYVSPERSYVFKPLTNDATEDRELWVYQHILHLFPKIYPQLLASSGPGRGEQSWTIYEDIGPLRHEYSLQHALRVAKEMACWHSRPTTHWDGIPAIGPKPPIEQIASELLVRADEIIVVMKQMGISNRFLEDIRLVAEGQVFTGEKVLCHGDLHLGNYAETESGEIYILDWEHAHPNLPLWDLYHLIDMSHPLFPKQMTSADREAILNCYIDQTAALRGTQGNQNKDSFKQDYYLFAALFSLWMLLLIQGDLRQEITLWPKDKLLTQWEETSSNLMECLELLDAYKVESNYIDKTVNL